MEYLSLEEARELGIIQEINRRLLHPRGLALEVIADQDTGAIIALGGIQDHRSEPDGVMYEEVRQDRVDAFDTLLDESKRRLRYATLGYVVQPAPNGPESDTNLKNLPHWELRYTRSDGSEGIFIGTLEQCRYEWTDKGCPDGALFLRNNGLCLGTFRGPDLVTFFSAP